ncbi:hypothetical protein C4580_06525 [Candidatus Woesearchaeota archaeon]|nr:MAG: hypothetical protein C4580_06525 [Candidatus Woesearchaeota archaeon]
MVIGSWLSVIGCQLSVVSYQITVIKIESTIRKNLQQPAERVEDQNKTVHSGRPTQPLHRYPSPANLTAPFPSHTPQGQEPRGIQPRHAKEPQTHP